MHCLLTNPFRFFKLFCLLYQNECINAKINRDFYRVLRQFPLACIWQHFGITNFDRCQITLPASNQQFSLFPLPEQPTASPQVAPAGGGGCKFPGAPAHSTVQFTDESLPNGAVASYSCERGFELLGPARRVCDNGQWIPEGIPFCGKCFKWKFTKLHFACATDSWIVRFAAATRRCNTTP